MSIEAQRIQAEEKKMTEEKRRFIEAFTTQFLANWAADNYPEACLSGRIKRFAQLAPIEDAFCIAEVMYRKWREERGD